MKKYFILGILQALLCTSSLGQPYQMDWARTYGGSDNDYGQSAIYSNDGTILVVGIENSDDGDVINNLGCSDVWLLQLDSSGNILRSKTFGSVLGCEGGYGIKQYPDGKIVLLGTAGYDVSGCHGWSLDYWVVMIDSAWNILWQRCLGAYEEEVPSNMVLAANGDILITGYSDSPVGGDVTVSYYYGYNPSPWVVRLDSSGNLLWEKMLGGYGSDYGTGICESSTGNIYVAGYADNNVSWDTLVQGIHGEFDILVYKLTGSGDILWQKCYGSSTSDFGFDIISTADSGFALTGFVTANDYDVHGLHGLMDVFLLKGDSSGNVEWTKCIGGTGYDVGNSIRNSHDGGYLIAGNSSSIDGDVSVNHGVEDMLIVKTDSTGNVLWTYAVGGSDLDYAESVDESASGKIVIAGKTESNDGDIPFLHGSSYYDFFLAQFSDPTSGIVEVTSELSGFTARYDKNAASLKLSYYSEDAGMQVMDVFDIRGRSIESTSFNGHRGFNRKEISVPVLSGGIYLVTLKGAAGTGRTKILVE